MSDAHANASDVLKAAQGENDAAQGDVTNVAAMLGAAQKAYDGAQVEPTWRGPVTKSTLSENERFHASSLCVIFALQHGSPCLLTKCKIYSIGKNHSLVLVKLRSSAGGSQRLYLAYNVVVSVAPDMMLACSLASSWRFRKLCVDSFSRRL